VLDAGGDPADPVAAEAAAASLRAEDLDRTDLRGPGADEASSRVATFAAVRAALLAFQRAFGAERGAVLDGRDIGTVIFPEAPVKLFVTASAEERGVRRWRELQARGLDTGLQEVTSGVRARDAQDAARATAPLRPADDAMLLDTTELDADTAFARALELIALRLSERGLA
jgi:cytidylate kinase